MNESVVLPKSNTNNDKVLLNKMKRKRQAGFKKSQLKKV
jgi:hypothetical protein